MRKRERVKEREKEREKEGEREREGERELGEWALLLPCLLETRL